MGINRRTAAEGRLRSDDLGFINSGQFNSIQFKIETFNQMPVIYRLALRTRVVHPFYHLSVVPRSPHSIRAMASSSSTLSKDALQTLRKYTACDIADALLKLKVPNAGFLPDLTLFAPPTTSSLEQITIAPASTVIFTSKSEDAPSHYPAANIPAGKHWVDLTQPETIVVMSQPEGQKCAVLGGILALRMKVLNAKGVVVSGRVRDVVELGETGLPVSLFGTGACFRGKFLSETLQF
jgi:regulator of RNase E activity RraA